MTDKLERVYRDRPLTVEEIVRDEEIRRQVKKEFPPSTQSAYPAGRFSQTLREALRASGRSVEQIASEANVSPILVAQFLSGERDIRLATADKLAEVLGLQLATA